MSTGVIILAAGRGSRMHSNRLKVLHTLANQPMLTRLVKTAASLNPSSITIVYHDQLDQLQQALADLQVTTPIQWAHQGQPQGTGHAVSTALDAIPALTENQKILVLLGDTPLMEATTLQELITATPTSAVGLLLAKRADPQGLGRVITDQTTGEITAIIEEADATEAQKAIQTIWTGTLCAPGAQLPQWLSRIDNHNAQQEYYLPSMIPKARQAGVSIMGVYATRWQTTQGINTQHQLAQAERYLQEQQAITLMQQGLKLTDPARFDLRGTLQIAPDISIDINAIIEGNVTIGQGTTIGPNVQLRNVTIGEHVTIKGFCVIEDTTIASHCTIGPFAHLRAGTKLEPHAKIGNFVETKNTTLGAHSKANHLSYLGDAHIGERVNIGAGTITCNYDGKNKHPTTIEDGAFIGSGTELIAPVTIGKNALIGAGSTITRSAPADQITLRRAVQRSIDRGGSS